MTDTDVVVTRRGRTLEPRAENVAVVDEVRAKLSTAGAAILTEYRGLTVSDLQALRRSLRQAGGEYRVYKNTLVRFATRELGIDGIEALLEGPTAIAFADTDVPGVAKALREFSRTNPLLIVKGGVMGSTVLTPDDAAALADIPSREVLLARLAGLIAAPLQQFASALQALPRNFAYGLKALIDDRGGVPAAEEVVEEVQAAAPAAAAEPAEAAAAQESVEAADAVEAEAAPVEEPVVAAVPAEEPTAEAAPEAEAETATEAEAAPEAAPAEEPTAEAAPEAEADTAPEAVPVEEPTAEAAPEAEPAPAEAVAATDTPETPTEQPQPTAEPTAVHEEGAE